MSDNPEISEVNEAGTPDGHTVKPHREKSPPALSVYLGPAAKMDRRMKALDDIAERLSLKGRSTLIQWIADGRLQLVVPNTPYIGPDKSSEAPSAVEKVAAEYKKQDEQLALIQAREKENEQAAVIQAEAILKEHGAEIKQYIEEHIDDAAQDEPGWHARLAGSLADHYDWSSNTPLVIRLIDLIHEQAERRGLYPYDSSRGRDAARLLEGS